VPIPDLHSTPPLGGGFPSEYRHPVCYGNTRMVWLLDGEKISKIRLFVLTWSTNVTDGQTDGHCMTAIAAFMHSIARQKSRMGLNESDALYMCSERGRKLWWHNQTMYMIDDVRRHRYWHDNEQPIYIYSPAHSRFIVESIYRGGLHGERSWLAGCRVVFPSV